jgi:type I restriction enzyme S subunit
MSFSSWREVKIGDVCDVKGGKRLPKGSKLINEPTEHPYIRIRDMYQHKYIENNGDLEYVDEETFKKINRYITNSGDVIIAIVGNTIGLVSLVGRSLDNASLTENCVKLINLKECLSEFIYYYLITEIGQNDLKSKIVGTSQPKLPIYGVKDICMRLPIIEEQKKIIDILSTLDEKIEVNNQINKTLENMAQAIFKQWFVDFEFPNEDGEPYTSSGGKMVESELGMIPKGWEIAALGELADIQKGLSYKGKHLVDSGIPMMNLGNIKPGGGFRANKMKYYNGEFKERHVVQPGDILIANTDMTQDRVILGSPCIVPVFNTEKIIFTHHLFAFRAVKLPKSFLYYYLTSDSFRIRAESHATGTTVLALQKESVINIKLSFATGHILQIFDDIVSPIISKIEKNNYESQKLSDIRDFILPKLMSGEIRVPLDSEGEAS